jgi:Sulfotransferase family
MTRTPERETVRAPTTDGGSEGSARGRSSVGSPATRQLPPGDRIPPSYIVRLGRNQAQAQGQAQGQAKAQAPSPSAQRSTLWFFAVYLYVVALYLYFAMGFAFLNRLAVVKPERVSTGGAASAEEGSATDFGGGSLRFRPPLVAAEPRSDGAVGVGAMARTTDPDRSPGPRPASELGEGADPSVLPGRAIPLVVRRDAHGAWHPHFSLLNASMTTIRRHLFEDRGGRDWPTQNIAIPDHRKRDVLGVVRITKTGSTSLLSFLLASKSALTYDYVLNVDRTLTVAGEREVPYCFYGTNPDPPNVRHPVRGQCGHRTYARMVSVFAKQLARYQDDTQDQDQADAVASIPGHSKAHGEPLQLSLSIITMVRDPFDRMLSFFRYFREIYPDWAPMYKAQPQVLQTLKDGDFPAFLRELALLEDHEWTRRYQYEYFGADADEAIETVREVRVLPLLNECFNASMLLLAHQYPALFPSDQPDATHKFLASGNSHSRKTGAGSSPASIHPDLHPVQEFDRETVRLQARQSWLRNEYRFYDESKRVLGRMLRQSASSPGSIVDADVVRECLDMLSLSPLSPELSENAGAFA